MGRGVFYAVQQHLLPPGPPASLLGVSDELVGEEGKAVTHSLGVDEAHGFSVTGLAEEALASSEHNRVDRQPQFVDEVVLYQRVRELDAAVDDDVSV